MSAVLERGFADPVLDAQDAFRAVMSALANPGTPHALALTAAPPAALPVELGTIALTLCDHDTPVWLDPALASDGTIVDWLRFHAAVPIVGDPAQAAFAFVGEVSMLPPIGIFGLGTDEYPDRSTTIALALLSFTGGRTLTLRGPGIAGARSIAPQGLPDDFLTQWADNRAQFPRGVDLLLVAEGQVLGLPRTTRITSET